MNNDVKQRIEQINRGEVPEGYKKTAVGIVPQEWEETQLSKIFVFKNGLNKEKKAFGSGTPIVNYVDVWKKRGIKAKDVTGRVMLSEKEIENYNVKKGDVFFTRTSETKEEIGLSSVMLDDIENAVFSGFVLRARPVNKKIYTAYNQYCYSSKSMRYEVIRKSSITTRALTSGSSLGKVHINLPSIEEQQRIADILSKWDEAIELQEKLIEKLELQKKALMQRLLTPKEDWKKVNLGEICSISTGKLDVNAMVENGKYPFFTCSKQIYQIDNYAFDCEALLIAGNGDIGDIKYYCGKFNAYQRTYVLNNFVFPIKYVMYYLEKHFQKSICLGTQKSSMPYIKLDTLLNSKIRYSPDKIELTINIFEVIDENLNMQKKKLNKLKQQQKVMQQLLLTGIVRV